MSKKAVKRGVNPRITLPDNSWSLQYKDKDEVDGGNLSNKLWDNSQDLAYKALETEFLHGIRHGSLHPDKYGGYSIQDAAYCFNAIKDYEIVIRKTKNADVKKFLEQRLKGYSDYVDSIKETWYIKNAESIEPGTAAQNYIDFEGKIASNAGDFNDEVYFVVAMIPCSRLWYWLANQMAAYEGPGNAYSFWIRENKQGDGGKKLEDFVNKYQQILDKDEANEIYREAMRCEVNFMRSACQQELLPCEMNCVGKDKDREDCTK